VIAIDSTPLIHLSKIGRLDILENCSLITTESVRGEVVIEGKVGVSMLKEFFKRVEVVKLSEKDIDTASSIVKSEYVHQADAELLLLAKRKNCTLLTNDRALILLARSMGIKVWWVTTLLLNLVKAGRLNKEDGKYILDDLIMSGMRIETGVYIMIRREIEIVSGKHAF
jgi:predicted nucleic acid-binding protein